MSSTPRTPRTRGSLRRRRGRSNTTDSFVLRRRRPRTAEIQGEIVTPGAAAANRRSRRQAGLSPEVQGGPTGMSPLGDARRKLFFPAMTHDVPKEESQLATVDSATPADEMQLVPYRPAPFGSGSNEAGQTDTAGSSYGQATQIALDSALTGAHTTINGIRGGSPVHDALYSGFRTAAQAGIGAGVTALTTPYLGPLAPVAGGVAGKLSGIGLDALHSKSHEISNRRKQAALTEAGEKGGHVADMGKEKVDEGPQPGININMVNREGSSGWGPTPETVQLGGKPFNEQVASNGNTYYFSDLAPSGVPLIAKPKHAALLAPNLKRPRTPGRWAVNPMTGIPYAGLRMKRRRTSQFLLPPVTPQLQVT